MNASASRLISRQGPLRVGAICAVASMLAYFVVVGQPVWGTNDDAGMSMRAAGVVAAAEPTGDLLFIHVFMGGVLKQLHLLWPWPPWYGLAFLAILLVSLIVLNHSIFRLRRDPAVVGLVAVADLATVVPALWHLQFTVVGGVAALAGMSVLLSQTIRRSPGATGFAKASAVSLILLFVGGMTRYQSCLMVLALTLPVYGIFVMGGLAALSGWRQKLRHIGIYVLVPVLGGGGVMVLEAIDRAHYGGSEDWSRWVQLNKAKAAFVDFKQVPYDVRTQPAFDAVGWTKNDHAMIMSWQYLDPVHFSLEKFQSVLSDVAKAPAEETGARTSVDLDLRIRYDFQATARILPLFPLLMVAGLFLVEWRVRSLAGLIILAASVVGLILFLYAGFNRAPRRVLLVLWFAALWPLLMMVAGSKRKVLARGLYGRIAQGGLVAVLLVLCILRIGETFSQAVRTVGERVQKYDDLQETLTAWSRHLPDDAVIYSIGATLPFKHQLPLASLESFRPFKGIISTGTGNQSPTQRGQIASLGLGTDFYRDLADQPNVFLAQRAKRVTTEKELAILRTFYREKYGMEVVVSEVPELPGLLRMEFRQEQRLR